MDRLKRSPSDENLSVNRLARRQQRRLARRRQKLERSVRRAVRDAIAPQVRQAIEGADEALKTLHLLQQVDLGALSGKTNGLQSVSKLSGEGGRLAAEKVTEARLSKVQLPRLRLGPIASSGQLQPSAAFLNSMTSAACKMARLDYPVLVRSSSSPGHMRLLQPQQQYKPFSTSSAALLQQSMRASREDLAKRRTAKAARLQALLCS